MTVVNDSIEIEAQVKRLPGVCPACGHLSERTHGYYRRTLLDLPVSQFMVRIKLRVRRYYCRNQRCQRRTFTQQIHNFLQPYQRATNRMRSNLYHIGQALGGQAGARLAMKLAMPTSGDTLLRLIRRSPEPECGLLHALGVDDWALRKGQKYGTIVVDLERRQVVDLLPDRTAETLKSWLQKHDGIKVVARDRSKEYAAGISSGAPDALQVADRWHLLKNLRDTTERSLRELASILQKRITAADKVLVGTSLRAKFPRGQPDEQARKQNRLRRMKRYELVHYFKANGLGTRRIARLLGLSRGTVIRYANSETFPEWGGRRLRPSMLDPFLPYLESRVQASSWNAHQLWREIRDQGYPGSPSQVTKWMNWRRRQPVAGNSEQAPAPTPALSLPTTKELTTLLVRETSRLDEQDSLLLERLKQIPEIARIHGLVQSFSGMFRDKQPEALPPWLERSEQSKIKAFQRFSQSLKQDLAAVQAALETPYSNGQTEGQINRLKMLKRQMYGRAKLDLLKRRVM